MHVSGDVVEVEVLGGLQGRERGERRERLGGEGEGGESQETENKGGRDEERTEKNRTEQNRTEQERMRLETVGRSEGRNERNPVPPLVAASIVNSSIPFSSLPPPLLSPSSHAQPPSAHPRTSSYTYK